MSEAVPSRLIYTQKHWLALHKIIRPAGEIAGEILAFLIIVAAPLAMLGICIARILLRFCYSLLERISNVLSGFIQAKGGTAFSVAGLFSPSVLPYQLYPLSGGLLE
jgi:hypothetical protein